MKKQLLLGSALLAAISAFPQNGQMRSQPTKVVDMAKKMADKYRPANTAAEASPFQAPATAATAPSVKSNPQARTANTASFSAITSWNRFTGSENIYGMLVSTSRPLQYNDELGRVSFVHRKSHTYIGSPAPAPTASTGAITADITNSWGQVWDSTALWGNDAFWARYPNGGIYNTTPTNTNAAQAYIIGTGPVTTAASSWQGNWFASKQLDTVHGAHFNNVFPTAPGAMQFIANTGTGVTGALGKVDFARLDFAYTDDGNVHALGQIMKDANGTTFATQLTRGARIIKATFNSGTGTFTWAGDSIIPPAIVNSDGHAMLLGDQHMAWKEDGSVGYVFFIGCRQGATGPNKGNQPIVYKTTDHGATWNITPSIDFSTPTMSVVLKHLRGTSAVPTQTVPFFNVSEGIDGIVDANGKLHIFTTIISSESSFADSLNFQFQFTNSLDGESYAFPHTPGEQPYLYDFISDGSSWNLITVDSMSSESPGSGSSAENGFTNNPWDIDPTTNSKVAIDARLQMSRTPDGKYIIYTWAESDSVTTNNGVKWNYNPNIKARLLNVTNMTVHPTELNVTSPPNINDANPDVRGFAYNHYTSTKCALSTNSTPNSLAFFVPMTVSNNASLHQLEPINHYYSSAVLNFDNLATVNPPSAPDYHGPAVDTTHHGGGDTTGIAVNFLNSAKASVIYPNPAKGSAVLSIDMKDNATLNVSVLNIVGQEVKAVQIPSQIGQNNISLDLNGLQKGIYMVNVKVGNAISAKKLAIE